MGISVYQIVTDRIISELEKGNIPWKKPWMSTGAKGTGAYSRTTGRPYSLLNQMMLPLTGEYATHKQITEAGGHIRKGEKSNIVVFFNPTKIKTPDKEGNEVEKIIPLLKYYNVFHVATQCDNINPKQFNIDISEFDSIENAEKLIEDYRNQNALLIKEVGSDKAFYSPSMDYVNVPKREQFTKIEEFYSTLFHELVHSTGHKTRLNRFDDEKSVAFGSEVYSKEELVAEIGSASILNELKIETESSFKNSVAYIQSWIKVLKSDMRFIVTASSKAEKAVNYIKGIKALESVTE